MAFELLLSVCLLLSSRRYCDCAVDVATSADLRATQLAYYDELKRIADDAKYTQRQDFAVVLQPFLVDFLPIDVRTLIQLSSSSSFSSRRPSNLLFKNTMHLIRKRTYAQLYLPSTTQSFLFFNISSFRISQKN